MKKCILIVFLVMSTAAFGQTSAIKGGAGESATARQSSKSYWLPFGREESARIIRENRAHLMQQFAAARDGFREAFHKVERVIQDIKKSGDPHLPKETTLREGLWKLSVYDRCREKETETQLKLTAAHAENAMLRQRLAALQKESPKGASTAVPSKEAKELEQRLITVQQEAEGQKILVKEMIESNEELPQLANLKKRTRIEFGKKVYEKMIAGKDLEIPDFFEDKKARLGKLISSLQKGLEESLDQESPQMKLALEKLKYDNKKCNTELAELKKKAKEGETLEEQDQEKEKQKEKIADLQSKNKMLKEQIEKLKTVSSVEGATDALLAKDNELQDREKKLRIQEAELEKIKKQLAEAQQRAKDTLELEEGYAGRVNVQLSKLFGKDFAEAITSLYELGDQEFMRKIDHRTQFMQKLCPHSQDGGWFEF